jgi:hypothetical protein
MSFWTNSGFEPKQDFKWQVTINYQDGNLPSFYAKSVKKPAFSVNMKTYKLVNREIRQPQNLTWEPIDIVLIDTVDSPVVKFVKSYLEKTEYTNVVSASLTNTTTSKIGSNNFLIEVKIEQLDSTGKAVEIWQLYNPQISRFTASELNYESDALSTYTLTIDYDWANLSEAA